MGDRLFGFLDMTLVGIVVLGFIAWQIRSINREIAKDKSLKDKVGHESPDSARHPIGEHRLDDR